MKPMSLNFIAVLLLMATVSVLSQGLDPGKKRTAVGVPRFDIKIINTFNQNDGARHARVLAQIANDYLTFVKNDSGFGAELELELRLSAKESDFSYSKTINREVFEADYDNTNSNAITNTFMLETPIKAGKYDAVVAIRDLNSNSNFGRKASFEVPEKENEDEKLRLSDFLFFDQYLTDENGGIMNYAPSLQNNFQTEGDEIYATFHTWRENTAEPLTVRYKILDENQLVVHQNQFVSNRDEKYLTHYIKLNRYTLNENKYYIEVMVEAGEQQTRNGAIFEFFWDFVPNSSRDLELAIRQLEYIAEGDSVKYYRDAPYEEQRGFFRRFWHQKDPNPDSEENELMREYYRRINFSTANFSTSGEEGWRTDRGRLLVKFGEPDDVERHPFEAGSYPYIIWRYYASRKNFLFIDRTGFGNYELHPDYYYVEYE